nr:zinc finger, CCHC-type [Tanacetum cinerariifolium]
MVLMITTMVLVPTRNQSWNVKSMASLVTLKGIVVEVKRTMQMLVVQERDLRTNPKTKTYELVEDGSVLYMGDDHFTLVHVKESVVLEFSLGKSITLFKVLYVPKLCNNLNYGLVLNKCGYKQVYESDKYILSKSGVFVGFGYYNNGYKWIFKRKLKVDGTVDKFKARLVIQGFREKEGIDYFHTYALVSRITIIRFLLALAAIHNLVIHQMDVKLAFLNGDLDKEVYMKQLGGFVMLVDKTKKFLSSKFSVKDMGEADVILCIKIKLKNKGIAIIQSNYIEEILKKFNREDCSLVSTPTDPVEKLKPNTVDQLECLRAIVCLMYAMTSTRLAYAVGRLSKFSSNPSR